MNNDTEDDLRNVTGNLTQRATWLRILFMVGFCLALYVVAIVLLFITIVQALFAVVTGTDNLNLRILGANLAEYVNQILKFLTYNSQSRPFPFSPFPDTGTEPGPSAGGGGESASRDESEPATRPGQNRGDMPGTAAGSSAGRTGNPAGGEAAAAAIAGQNARSGRDSGNDPGNEPGKNPVRNSGGDSDDSRAVAQGPAKPQDRGAGTKAAAGSSHAMADKAPASSSREASATHSDPRPQSAAALGGAVNTAGKTPGAQTASVGDSAPPVDHARPTGQQPDPESPDSGGNGAVPVSREKDSLSSPGDANRGEQGKPGNGRADVSGLANIKVQKSGAPKAAPNIFADLQFNGSTGSDSKADEK